MADSERRQQERRDEDRGANGWKENQKFVLEALRELKRSQDKFSESQEKLRDEIRQNAKANHQTPCQAVTDVETKLETGVRVVRWFVTIIIALIGGIITLLFKVFSKGGTS